MPSAPLPWPLAFSERNCGKLLCRESEWVVLCTSFTNPQGWADWNRFLFEIWGLLRNSLPWGQGPGKPKLEKHLIDWPSPHSPVVKSLSFSSSLWMSEFCLPWFRRAIQWGPSEVLNPSLSLTAFPSFCTAFPPLCSSTPLDFSPGSPPQPDAPADAPVQRTACTAVCSIPESRTVWCWASCSA